MSAPTRREILLSCASIALLGVTRVVRADELKLAVVVGEKSAQRDVSMSTLRRIFQSKPTEDDAGKRIVPINMPLPTAVRQHFDLRVLRMTPEQVERYWIDQRLKDIRPPATVQTAAVLKRALKEIEGALGYLAVGEVGPGMRVLTIGGLATSDPKYPL